MRYRLVVEVETKDPISRKPLSVDGIAKLIGVLREVFGAETANEWFRLHAVRLEDDE